MFKSLIFMTVIDEPQRLEALDITQSFIVQAPAGSGKTELLTQRYLALLAQAKKPEEIIAITFTRKAASEMRLRILHALQDANAGLSINDPAKQRRQQLALAVLKRDQELQWHLLENPNRLRVQTIDSLCASITRQMPVLSHFGAQPAITDDANSLYETAAKAVLSTLEQQNSWSTALQILLLHRDNDHEKVIALFCDMLSQRDQWLTLILAAKNHHDLRNTLENNLQRTNDETIALTQRYLSNNLLNELIELTQYSLQQRQIESKRNIIFDIADLVLTQDNNWRKTIDIRNGFPPKDKMKDRLLAILAELAEDNDLLTLFVDIKNLPPTSYTDNQWRMVEALCILLPILAAQLQIVFQQHNTVDHIEIAQSALRALGDMQNPTDLTLILDYRIQHLLVDEFQDTSVTQINLLEKLTAGWQPNDGRTLFLVGDPMQSIYRFRKAEVGLFLQVRDYGIGNIQPKFLNLQTNFRSSKNIVDWINQTFINIFPHQENFSRGAITFADSVAKHDKDKNKAIHTHWLTDTSEAEQVLKVIQQSLLDNPEHSIAILVRSRSHVAEISQLMKQYQIAYRAIEIEKIAAKPAIQDLLALTRALMHLDDRIAWLAILRAPWSGLSLADLHTLATNKDKTIWNALQTYPNRIVPIIQSGLKQRGRKPLHQWIKGVWLALGGPACLTAASELDDVKIFFDQLAALAENYNTFDIHKFESQLASLYANNNQNKAQVEIMTMHKAKGLEFDTVILPGLGRAAAKDDSKLLLMMERPTLAGSTDLIFAPIKASNEKQDLIYQYLAYEEKNKSAYETMRLLYVAVTRAKKTLHLIGTVKNKNGEIKPIDYSLLGYLWPALAEQKNICDSQNNDRKIEQIQSLLKRLSADWQPPIQLAPTKITEQNADIQFEWNNDPARHIGTVIHLLLCKISRDGSQKIDPKIIKYLLLQNNVVAEQLATCITHVEQALSQTLQSERGRWILNNQHQDAHSEYPLTINIKGKNKQIIIDRTFVDENNIRWIIDYKTAENNTDIEPYREQLETYAKAMRLLDDRKIHLGLYFPLVDEWREWEF